MTTKDLKSDDSCFLYEYRAYYIQSLPERLKMESGGSRKLCQENRSKEKSS